MASIYIHIPYCKQACSYCNFHFSTQLANKANFIDALVQEIVLSKNYLNNQAIESVYFGGGTPSILSALELEKIFNALAVHHSLNSVTEITLEANPDDINSALLQTWKAVGINRLSIGVQSFYDEHLLYMNRAHNANAAIAAITLVRQANFTNYSLDLIYGFPLLSNEQWLHNLAMVDQLAATHLSCYALTIEPQTALHHLIKTNKTAPINDEQAAIQFDLLTQWAGNKNWQHYEISNLSKAGYKAVHNSNYWRNKKYLGLGAGAHSFNGDSRRWNVANNNLYISSLANNTIPFEEEILSTHDKINEYIMTSLRTTEGINKARLSSIFNNEMAYQNWLQQLALVQEHLIIDATDIILKANSRFLADGIASDLFVEK